MSGRSTLVRLLLPLALVGTIGCGPRVSAKTSAPPTPAAQEVRPSGSGLPEAVQCTFAWRETDVVKRGDAPDDPKVQIKTRHLRVAQDGKDSVKLGDGILTVGYRVPKYDVPTIEIRAKLGGKETAVWLYQLSSSVQNQFIGDHGFTGLVYLAHPSQPGDYQFFCQFAWR